jgi:hypothetical protein
LETETRKRPRNIKYHFSPNETLIDIIFSFVSFLIFLFPELEDVFGNVLEAKMGVSDCILLFFLSLKGFKYEKITLPPPPHSLVIGRIFYKKEI